MADMFSVKKRSEIMSRIRNHGNKATEGRLISIMRSHRIIGWRRNARLFGRPDFVFPTRRLAIFVDGCFWHSCPKHKSKPEGNARFWRTKLRRNVKRDRLVNTKLHESGWTVLRIWQHELKNANLVASKLLRRLR
jgi:DNA mismatch endonuclease (patch repair protein)